MAEKSGITEKKHRFIKLFYHPTPHKLSLIERFKCIFSRKWRVLRRLEKAPGELEKESLWKKIEGDANWFSRRTEKLDERNKDIQIDVLTILTWRFLSVGSTSQAANWLNRLREMLPESERSFILCLQLLVCMAEREEFQNYTEYASILLKDSRINIKKYAGAAKECLNQCYTNLSPIHCIDLIKKAHHSLEKESWFNAVVDLCMTPDYFTSHKKLKKHLRKISPEIFSFSPAMKADALIAKSRQFEWTENFSKMREILAEAEKLCPDNDNLHYWNIRVSLQLGARNHDVDVDVEKPGQGKRWERLVLIFRLYQDPEPTTTKPVIPYLKAGLEKPEQELILILLEKALRISIHDSNEKIRDVAGICSSIEKAIQCTLPFTRFGRGLKALKVDHLHREALGLLDDDKVVKLDGAWETISAARVLCGELNHIMTTSLSDLLDEFDEKCLHSLPELGQMKQLASMVPGVVSKDPDTIENLRKFRPIPEAPAWMTWLFSRCCLILLPPEDLMEILDNLKIEEPSTAWEIAFWASESAPLSIRKDSSIEDVMNFLNHKGWAALYNPPDNHSGLGSFPDRISTASHECVRKCKQIRELSGVAERGKIAERFVQLKKDFQNEDPLLHAFLDPWLTYWQGVNLLHMSDSSGKELLESICESWMRSPALAQLALREISIGNYSKAESWLSDIHSEYESASYAWALLLSRKGNIEEAREALALADNRFGEESTVYSAASRRLAAAIEERAGKSGEAARQYIKLLSDNPEDEIAAVRLLRILLQQRYEEMVSKDFAGDESIDEILSTLEDCHREDGWGGQIEDLARVLSWNPDKDITSAVNSARKLDAKGQRLMAYRLLGKGMAAEARETIDSNTIDPSLRRVQAILEAWHCLSRIWTPDSNSLIEENESEDDYLSPFYRYAEKPGSVSQESVEQLKKCLEELGKACKGAEDSECNAWKSRIEMALDIVSREESSEQIINGNELGMLRPEERNGWNDQQRYMAEAVDALSKGEMEYYIESYDELTPFLDELPVDGIDLWLSAARQWFESGNWEMLLESDLPQCVADIADPRVRMIIGLAYARLSAAQAARGKIHKAVTTMRRARGTLEPMVNKKGD